MLPRCCGEAALPETVGMAPEGTLYWVPPSYCSVNNAKVIYGFHKAVVDEAASPLVYVTQYLFLMS